MMAKGWEGEWGKSSPGISCRKEKHKLGKVGAFRSDWNRKGNCRGGGQASRQGELHLEGRKKGGGGEKENYLSAPPRWKNQP